MNTKPNLIFFLKTIILLFVFSGIGLLVNGLFQKTSEQKTSNIPFLAISDKQVDSIISKLSNEQKVDIILREIPKLGEGNLDSLSKMNGLDSANVKQSDNQSKNGKPFNIQDIIDLKDQFIDLDEYEYFDAITDSAFIFNYLKYNILTVNGNNSHFIYQRMTKFEPSLMNDSNYVRFSKSRLEHEINIFRNVHELFGLRLNVNYLMRLDSLDKKNPLLIDSLFQIYKNELDFVLIDSIKNPESFEFKPKGLCMVQFAQNALADDNNLIKFLDKNIDIYFIQSIEYQKYRKNILDLIQSGAYKVKNLDSKLRKILKAKIWQASRIMNFQPDKNLSEEAWHQQLVEKSICLLSNPDSLLPVKSIENKTFNIIWIGNSINKSFIKYCNEYVSVSSVLLQNGQNNWQSKIGKPVKKNFYILVLDTGIQSQTDNQQFIKIIRQFDKSSLAIVNIKNYQNLNFISDSISCIQVQSNTDCDYQFAAQALFGGISLQGQLPKNISKFYKFGLKNSSPKTRVQFGHPGTVGIDKDKLSKIDQIVQDGIRSGAFPGCQVFVIKDGEVIYDKCFGYHTWNTENPVKSDDVYDLASVTKIAATTIASMKMMSDRKMFLTDQLGKFFKNTTIDYTRIKADTLIKIDTFLIANIQNWKKFLKQNDTLNLNDSCFVTIDTVITRLTPKLNIFRVPLVDLLMHKSGIIPATPIFRYMYYREYYFKQMKQKVLAVYGKTSPIFNIGTFDLPASFPDNTGLSDSLKQLIKAGFKKQYLEYFSKRYVKDSSDKVQLTENLYLKNRYFDTIWRDTKQMPVYSRKVFQYSDVNMILLQLAIDSLNQMSIDEYMKKTIYNPLGLKTITYLPLKYYPKTRIIPTEMDDSWRYGYLHGFVHDPSSALMGGMVGNAGLYSNARDLGILFQMILNQGKYGGNQYISPSIIQTFTTRDDETQRGLGFDMPNMKTAVGTKAPKNTYGHTGYTGTCVWVDPENQLVYVFLSNRNNTSAKNWKLNTYKIRERIHDAIYDSFIQSE